MRDLYFEKIELIVPQDFSLSQSPQDPYFGTPYSEYGKKVYPFIKEIGGGKMHVMPSEGWNTIRRFAIPKNNQVNYANELAENLGLSFSIDGTSSTNGERLYSWNNPFTGNYFAQGHYLPSMAFYNILQCRNEMNSDYNHIKNIFETGADQYPAHTGRLGWAHPLDFSMAGAHGGTGIEMFEGIKEIGCQSLDGYLRLRTTGDMYIDRQHNFLFNKDGSSIDHDDWVIPDGCEDWLPITMFNYLLFIDYESYDPFGYYLAPDFQVNHVSSQGLNPPYESDLNEYKSIDYAHLTRVLKFQEALAWIGNDAVGKDNVDAIGRNFRLSLTEKPSWACGNDGHSASLKHKISDIANEGETAGVIGRNEAWG